MTSLPKLEVSTTLAAPPTVGRYRHRAKISPSLNVPTPVFSNSSFPPHSVSVLMKDDYFKKRYQQNPGFTEADLTEALHQHSQYLQSNDISNSAVNEISTLKTKVSLPEIPFSQKWMSPKSKKTSRFVWVPRLSLWVPDDKNSNRDFFHLGFPSTITVKHLPICSEFHDFYHHALNWDVRHKHQEYCDRFLHHRNKKNTGLQSKETRPKLDPLNKKPPTIPKDPFSSKSERNLKQSVLKDAMQMKEKARKSKFAISEENSNQFYPSRWMVDNSTMTEDSLSDVTSNISNQHFNSKTTEFYTPVEPFYIEKRRKTAMVDKACTILSPHLLISSPVSHHTTESAFQDIEEIHESESGSLNLNNSDENKNDEFFRNNEEENKRESFHESILLAQDVAGYIVETENEEISETEEGLSKNDKSYDELEDNDVEEKETEETILISANLQNTLRYNIEKSPEKKKRRIPPIPSPKLLEEQSKPIRSIENSLKRDNIQKQKSIVVVPQPLFAEHSHFSPSLLSRPTSSTTCTSSSRSSKRRGKAIKDQAIAEELRRARLAEGRKRKATEKFAKIKNSRRIPLVNSPIRFFTPEEDDFLGKYCIHNPNKMDEYRRVFNSFDIDEDGFLDADEVFLAVQKVMPAHPLRNSHINHIYRLLEMADYKVEKDRIDFKLFAILASLAQRISTLDEFMKGLIEKFDLQSLDGKMWRARKFFRHFADDEDKQTISMESLWIELKAGGFASQHERQIREALQHLPYMDLMDFLTYLPLFAFTHSQAIFNPLNNEKVN